MDIGQFCRGKGWKVIYRFPIAHIGWEMDNMGAIATDADGQPHYVSTNHGQPIVMGRVHLQALRDVTAEWLANHDKALAVFDRKANP